MSLFDFSRDNFNQNNMKIKEIDDINMHIFNYQDDNLNEEDKDNITNWIEEARIYGEGFEEMLTLKRVRGINRNILNKTLFGNKILIVEINVHSDFIEMVNNNTLYIYNSINSYVPKSILLCWKSKEI